MTVRSPDPDALASPTLYLGIGVTGHRANHPVFGPNRAAIEETLSGIMTMIDGFVDGHRAGAAPSLVAPPRLYALLANGADLLSVKQAVARGWQIAAPLPFGFALNLAINALPETVDDADALIAGTAPPDPVVAERAAEIQAAATGALLFELGEQDEALAALFRSRLEAPGDTPKAVAFQAAASERAAVAARVMVEQSDIVIGIWDGVTPGMTGGTRHTIAAALDLGVPVLWIDARTPANWRVLYAPEEMAGPGASDNKDRAAQLQAIIQRAIRPEDIGWVGVSASERWRPRNNPVFQAYRRIEAVFGEEPGRRLRSMTQHYEDPRHIAEGSGAPLLGAARALPGVDARLVDQIAATVMRPFAWADGVSTRLSDAYRGGMVTSFFLSAFAIIGGIAYLPFASVEWKWAFAAFEFVLLAAIIAITFVGRKRHWHGRWFETRRVAEYFRHAPVLLLLGAARSSGRWPRGPGAAWPEWYAIHTLSAIGLPKMKVTPSYLRGTLCLMRDQHVIPQRDYHRGKAARLKRAQGKLDRFSEVFFILAVISVAGYLLVELGAALGLLPVSLPHAIAKPFTFLGVLFPTLGGAFAGVHYFGDFERFASISEITAQKLDGVATRITILLGAPDGEIRYARVADIAHAIDDIVVSEIENWQAVFGGKHITVPV